MILAMRKIAAALAALLLSASAALAQSGCAAIQPGAVLTAAQWNACFQAKQDAFGFIPLNRAGGVMTGPLITFASTTTNAGLRVPHGTAPTTPTNGDVWTTTAGMFVRLNGVTYQVGTTSSGGGPTNGVPAWNAGGLFVDSGLRASSAAVTTGAWQGTAVAVGFGGTGAGTAAGARTNLGLGTMATQAASAVAITGGTITGMGLPSANSDVANKQYVDSVASGLRSLAAADYSTAAALPNTPTYNNGASGVGATLTAGANAAIVVDGVTPVVGNRILVRHQASAFQNGVYAVTTVGSGAAAWVLTRVTDFDQAAEMVAGTYILVSSGSTQSGTSWVLQTTVATVGTDAVNFNQFSSSSVISFNARAGAVVPRADDYGNLDGLALKNCTLSAGAAANVLTVSLKDYNGADPTSSTPCVVIFRSATLSNGTTAAIAVTAPTSFTFSAGSSAGTTAGIPFSIWMLGINDAGTFRLGAIKASTDTAFVSLDETALVSSTAEGGSGTADSAGIIYTGTAVASKAMRTLGVLTWETGVATPGNWTAPTQVQLYSVGMPKPGQPTGNSVAAAAATGGACTTSATYVDSILTATITPKSAANYVQAYWSGVIQTTAGNQIGAAVMRRGGSIVGTARAVYNPASGTLAGVSGSPVDQALVTSPITYTVGCLSADGSNPMNFPSNAGGTNAVGSEIVLTEIRG